MNGEQLGDRYKNNISYSGLSKKGLNEADSNDIVRKYVAIKLGIW